MHVRSDSLGTEVRTAVEAAFELANLRRDGTEDLAGAFRATLLEHDFLRVRSADRTGLDEVVERFVPVARLIDDLPEVSLSEAVDRINDLLDARDVAPSLSAHDESPVHIHWTADEASLGRQIVVDVLMALAQTVCDDGVDRFGRCGASDCDRVFFDNSKNRSRRFCSDPRCASRTHTQLHRARRRQAG